MKRTDIIREHQRNPSDSITAVMVSPDRVTAVTEFVGKHPDTAAVTRYTQEQTAQAFNVLKESLQLDPEYAWSWQCNLAMCAYDKGVNAITANKAAARFMKLCFDVDVTASPQWKSLGIAA